MCKVKASCSFMSVVVRWVFCRAPLWINQNILPQRLVGSWEWHSSGWMDGSCHYWCMEPVIQIEGKGNVGLESLNISVSQGQKQYSALQMQCGIFQFWPTELIARIEQKPWLGEQMMIVSEHAVRLQHYCLVQGLLLLASVKVMVCQGFLYASLRVSFNLKCQDLCNKLS